MNVRPEDEITNMSCVRPVSQVYHVLLAALPHSSEARVSFRRLEQRPPRACQNNRRRVKFPGIAKRSVLSIGHHILTVFRGEMRIPGRTTIF